MDMIPYLPSLQAVLNTTAATLMTIAYFHIRRKNKAVHRALMIAALGVSALFLTSYLIYHLNVGNIPFAGQGGVRIVYFSILASHVILAAAIVPLVLITVIHAAKGRFSQHRRIARWTLPLWLYVSVTGVVIYLMAFHMYPPADAA